MTVPKRLARKEAERVVQGWIECAATSESLIWWITTTVLDREKVILKLAKACQKGIEMAEGDVDGEVSDMKDALSDPIVQRVLEEQKP